MEAFLLIFAIVTIALLMKSMDGEVKKSQHCRTHTWNDHYTNEEVYLGMYCSVCSFKAGTT